MRKISISTLLLLLTSIISFFSQQAFASDAIGKVDWIITRNDGFTAVWLKNVTSIGTKPACATIAYWIIKDENSEAGKKQYAMLLSAKMSDVFIRIYGNDTCTRWGDGEDILAVRIEP